MDSIGIITDFYLCSLDMGGRQNGGNHCQGTGSLQQPRYMRGGREVQEGGEMCTRMANSC